MATVNGGAGDDVLHGTAESDLLLGGGGADTLLAGAGEDTLDGGAGRDRAVLDRSGDTASIAAFMLSPARTGRVAGAVLTGVEDLTLLAGSGDDGLVGGAGDDSLSGGAGADAIQGGAGHDTLVGGDGADWLLGGLGEDVLAGGAGADRFMLLEAGAAALGSTLAAIDRILDFNPGAGDLLAGRGQAAGTALDAIASGTFAPPGGPLLPVGFGGALAPVAAPVAGLALPPDATGGAAWMLHWLPAAASGGGGWLVLDADCDGVLGTGDFVLRLDLPAGMAITAANFVPGTFALPGTGAADTLSGGGEDDTVLGLGGDDLLEGGSGNDDVSGGDGDDTLLGGADSDTLEGGAGADSMLGGGATDLLRGGGGGDGMYGGDGADLLRGDDGADALFGDDGDDTLVGGTGADAFTGGAGADVFVLREDGQPSASGLDAIDAVLDFSHAEDDLLRLSSASTGLADGSGATAGTVAGPDGVARPLLFVGGLAARESIVSGLALPMPRFPGLDARAVFWVPALESGAPAGGWLVLDADGDGALGAPDLVVRFGAAASPVSLDAADFVAGTFFSNEGGRARAGTAENDNLVGGSLGEVFIGSAGSDTIEGSAGSANALSYAGLTEPVAVRFTGYGTGTATKAGGGADSFGGIHTVSGTASTDTLDGSAAGGGLFVLSFDGGRGNDRILGDGGHAVQATYGGGPGAVLVDLHTGTAADGWGGTDTLADVRRVAVASAAHDTVLGSAFDDLFLSAGGGNKLFDGRGGPNDEYRYAGSGNITVSLTPAMYGGVAESAYVLKPDGTDRLYGIEAVSGGSGADSIVGSAAAERLAGGKGADTLDGGGGLDTVRYDVLSAGAPLPTRGAVVDLAAGTAIDPWGDADTLRRIENAWGSHGADSITGSAVAGTRTWLRGLAGADTLRAAAAGSLITADHAADPGGVRVDLAAGVVVDGWGDRDALVLIAHLRGSAFGDNVVGSAAANWIDGGVGDDTLDGGGGADSLLGGAGDDVFVVDNASDQAVELAGEGSDTVFASLAWMLGANLEALVLTGAGNAGGTGNALANTITGNAGANALSGGDGNDTLEGAAGDDSLSGGNDHDLLRGGDGADSLVGDAGGDALEGGTGNDRMFGGGDSDTLLGEAGADFLQGDGGTDLLIGGADADTLDGGDASDTLHGDAGADLLRGGDGADLLRGGTDADTLEGGGGTDVLWGEDARDLLRGDTGADLLDGGGDADTLEGGADADTLLGGAGADHLRGDAGDDALRGGMEDDMLEGGGEADLLLGDDGADRLDGGAGGDALLGGTEADTLLGGDGADLLFGEAGEDSLNGGAGDDTLDGGAGNDTLDGGAGANRLHGGAGDDLFVVRGAADIAFESADNGDDTVQTAASYWLNPNIEALALTGSAGIDGYGNAGANHLAGNAGANRLVGGAGADTLDGGAGRDTLQGGEGDDVFHAVGAEDAVVEWSGEGRDTVVADSGAAGYVLPPHVEDLVLGGATAHGTGNGLANRIEGNGLGNTLLAGAGDDTLLGRGGNDVLHGEAGADLFVFEAGLGSDRIVDFQPGSDRLLLRGLGMANFAGPVGNFVWGSVDESSA